MDDRLADILEYGTIAQDLASEPEALGKDVRLRLAFERALFLVGEAAAQIPPDAKASIDQPWPKIIGLRNVLAHRYRSLRLVDLLDIANGLLPSLLAALRR